MKLPVMIIYDVAKKVFDKKTFPQRNIAGLISGITFVFFQSGNACTVEGDIHICTHTCTHTHVHTHNTHAGSKSVNVMLILKIALRFLNGSVILIQLFF